MAKAAATPEGNGTEGLSIRDRFSLLDEEEEGSPEPNAAPAKGTPDPEEGEEDTLLDDELEVEEGVEEAPKEGDDVEDDAEADEDADGKESKDAPPEPKTFTVLVDGKEVVVNEEERGRGYLRQQDYTRKTTEAAELRKAAEAEKGAYAQIVTELRTYLDAAVAKEPTPEEWARMEAEDPTEFAVQKLKFREVRDQRDAAKAEETRLLKESFDKKLEEVKAHLKAEETKLLEKLPAWKNTEVAQKEKNAIQRFLVDRGFTPEEITQLGDHRLLLVVRDAALYARVKAKGKEKLIPVKKGTVMKPGGGRKPDAQEVRVRTVQEKARRTGSTRDAAERLLVSGLLDD